MDIKTLKASILSRTMPQFLIFNSHEPTLSKQYIEGIADAAGLQYKYFDTLDEVLYDNTTGLRTPCVSVVVEDSKPLKNSKYVDAITNKNAYIILLYSNIDPKKYKDFIKANESRIVTFDKLDGLSLLNYATKKCKDHNIRVSQDKLVQMVEYTNNDLGCLINELDKIFVLDQSNSDTLVDYMLKNGFSDYREPESDKFIEMVINGSPKAFEYYERFNKAIDSAVMLVYKMYSKYRECKDTKKILTGMRTCFEVYNGIVDGTMSDEYAIRYLMLKMIGD